MPTVLKRQRNRQFARIVAPASVALLGVAALVVAISGGRAQEPVPPVAEVSRTVVLPDGSVREFTVLVDTTLADPQAVLDQLMPAPAREGDGRLSASFSVFLKWADSSLPLKLYYNAKDVPVGIDGLLGPLQAIQTWNNIPAQKFRFSYEGTTGQIVTDCLDIPPDGTNTIGWRVLPIGVLGQVCRAGRPNSDGVFVAVEADLAFGTNWKWATSRNTPADSFDFYTVALHEMGHMLGLGHTNVDGSVMLPVIGLGVQHRVPSDDDVAGVRSLYADGTRIPTATPTHIPLAEQRFAGQVGKN